MGTDSSGDQVVKTKNLTESGVFDADGDNTAQAGATKPANLVGISVANVNNADAFLQLFDAATGDVTVGSTTPKHSIMIPKGDGTNYGAVDIIFDDPMKFSTALTYACTTTAAGSGDPTTGLIVNLFLE